MRVFSLVMLILSGFIGAGFASGREVANYFSRFGIVSFWGITIASVLLFLLILLFLNVADKFKSFFSFINKFFGRFSGLVHVLFLISVFILISSMLAGSGEIADVIGINKIVVVVTTAIIGYLITIGNHKCISTVSIILVPIIIIGIIYVCLISDKLIVSNGNILWSTISGSNYIFINIVSLGLFVLSVGKGYTKKEKIMASLLVSLIIGIVLFIFNIAILKRGLVNVAIPILKLSVLKGNFAYVLTIVIIWFALLTTFVANLQILFDYLKQRKKNKNYISLLIVFGGIIFSFCGFEIMVNYIYTFIGAVGFILILILLIKEKETDKIISLFRKR